MGNLTQKDRDAIGKILTERGADTPCPRCGNGEFAIADEYFRSVLQSGIENIYLDGPSIPAAVTICTKCGFISQHALGTLDLLSEKGG